MIRLRQIAVAAVLLIALSITGCSQNFDASWRHKKESEPELIKVMITFTDNQTLTGYIKSLGVEEDGKIYVGGSSLNYLYDVNGNIVGSYNYQRVLFIKILSEEENAGEL